MRLPLLISLSLLLLPLPSIRAQLLPADDFFNSGAQLYISNNIPSALEQVESGLKIYPDDEKLKKLEQLLKQKQQQQGQKQQQDQKDQQDQKNQSQQQKDQKSQQQKTDEQKNQQPDQKKSPDQQKQDDQKKSEAEKSDEEKKREEQKSAAEKKAGEKPEDQKGEGQPVAPGQMTPEEAKKLLDAQKGNEQVLKWQPKGKPENPNVPVKDW